MATRDNNQPAGDAARGDSLVPTELLDRLDYLFCKVAESLKRSADDSFVEVGLRSNHHTLLRVLGTCGPLSQQAIATRLLVDPSTVMDAVDQLEHRGWVVRTRKPTDRRAYLIDLTDEGQRHLKIGDERAARIQTQLFARLSRAEHQRLRELLERLAALPTEETPSDDND